MIDEIQKLDDYVNKFKLKEEKAINYILNQMNNKNY